MDRTNKLLVRYNGRLVGTMALYKNILAAFEYDKVLQLAENMQLV